jgi:hypothetical protein
MTTNKFSYSKSSIDKAGRFLIAPSDDAQAVDKAINTLNAWRSFHSFPLRILTTDLRKKLKRVQAGTNPVRRLKRTRSIIAKIAKESMRLTQMQDIGGCRAVVKDIDTVYQIKQCYIAAKMQHELVRIDDYIRSPKSSGYRSLHLVFKFKSKAHPEYNNILLEVQLRTITQHAWATAVETVGAVSGQALKSSEGEEDWLEYFKYASLALEHTEHPIFSTITPHSLGTISRRLSMLGKKLQVERKLTAYREALRATEKFRAPQKAAYYLLVLLPEQPQLQIFAYSRQNTDQAFIDYENFERILPMYPSKDQLPLFPDIENYSGAQAVLVGADSFKSIRESYPNYYLDTKVFVEKVDQFVKRYRRAP